MSSPHSRHHDLDLWDPIVQLPFLGEPIEDFLAVAKADGWDVDVYPLAPGDNGVRTLQVRYDYVPVRHRNGRVVSIGRQAPFSYS